MPNSSHKILIICGPTASGKTALALKLAQKSPTSIISADSRQIYQGLNILTGKDIPPGFSKSDGFYSDGQTRLFGFDLINPGQTMNAAQFSQYALWVIDREQRERRQIIIVGGTGFYLKAVTDPQSLAQVPPRDDLRQILKSLSLEDLQQQLWELDPQKFMALNDSDIKNPRRLTRAIEVLSSPQSRPPAPYEGEGREGVFNFSWLGLRLPLEQINERISLRVDARLDEAIEEVRSLQKDYPDQSLPIYTSIGVKQLAGYLSGEIPLEEARKLWISQEVNYAKRQITWFKKQSQIIWYDQDQISILYT